MSDPLSTFGARVAHLRALVPSPSDPDEPMSCSQLDRLAGLHRGHVWQIEQGEGANPKAATVVALATALGCTVGWLLAGEGAPPTADDVRAAVERARAKANASPGALGHTCNDFAPPASTEAA